MLIIMDAFNAVFLLKSIKNEYLFRMRGFIVFYVNENKYINNLFIKLILANVGKNLEVNY